MDKLSPKQAQQVMNIVRSVIKSELAAEEKYPVIQMTDEQAESWHRNQQLHLTRMEERDKRHKKMNERLAKMFLAAALLAAAFSAANCATVLF